jgi:hypothetical protein
MLGAQERDEDQARWEHFITVLLVQGSKPVHQQNKISLATSFFCVQNNDYAVVIIIIIIIIEVIVDVIVMIIIIIIIIVIIIMKVIIDVI